MPLYLGTEDAGTDQFSLQDFEPSFRDKLNAATGEAWLESYGPVALDWLASKRASEDGAKLTADEANARIKESGLRFSAKPGAQYTRKQLDILLERQRELTAIKDVRERTPWDMGSVVRGGAMFGAGIVDPINLATAFVPWTRSLSVLKAATVAESFAVRTGARAVLGAADAGISTAVLEPFFAAGRRDLGDDYTAVDSLANIAFGAAFGGGLHAVGGAGVDALRAWRGRAAGMVTPNPAVEAIAPPAGAVLGAETMVKIGEAREPAQFAVIEADALQATIDKADNQYRDRSRTAYQAEIQKRANALDPDLVLSTDNPLMDVGTPTVAADGRIIGGNGRTLFIDQAYEIGKAAEYRAALEAKLADLGLDPQAIAGMKKPILVRRLSREVDVKQAAMLSNEGGSTDMSALEQAKVDAERLGDARLAVGADGDLQAPENRAAIRRWVEAQPENKRNALVDEDGRLSAEGLRRLNGALIFKAYGDSPTLGRLVESMDVGSRNLATAIGRTAPVVAAARESIARGELHPLDIAGDVQLAVEKYNALREQGAKIGDYLAQLDAFGDGMTPEARLLLQFMGENIAAPRRIADAIAGFYEAVEAVGNPNQGDLLGGVAMPDKLALLDGALRGAEATIDTAAEVLARVSPETREAALRASVAQSVDGRQVEVEAIIGSDEAVGTATRDDLQAAAERNFEPESRDGVDFEAARAVESRVKAAPTAWALDDAAAAMADAEALLADTVAAGDEAYKFSRAGREAAADRSDQIALAEAIRSSFGDATPALVDAGRIKIVGTPDLIPGGPHPGDVKAATDVDGTVYIVAQNVTPAEARGLILHEVGVHVGMQTMLGPETYGAVLSQLDDAIMAGEAWAQRARAAVPADTPAALVREEQLAYLVQTAPELPIVQRIIAAIRAWAYRTFKVAQDSMTLTEADFRALAVSALHAVARGEADVPGGAGSRYARGGTPDPSVVADELKPYDERIARAKQYGKVLRAAADKLDSDAAATAAMKAALPDIAPAEIRDLLDGLRRQVKGLRSVARGALDALAAEDVAAGLQYEAMQAADELANNLEMAAVIEKRNAALNANARLKAMSFVNQFRSAGLDVEGFRGLLVGTERKRQGGRISVDAEQKNFRGEWIGGLLADIEQAGVREAFVSGAFDRDAYVALWNMAKGADNSKLPPEAVKIAEIVNKYQQDARNTRNRFGAWIRDLQGYIVRQSHDMYKIRDAGEKAWIEHTLPRLDIAKMQRLGLISDGDVQGAMRALYDDFATGQHMKPVTGEVETAAFGTGSNLARRESASRTLYFKDGNAAFEYNEKFGEGRLADAVLGGLDHAAKSAGLLKVLGTNPEATLQRLFDEYADSLRGDPVRRSKFLQSRKEVMENLLRTVDGSANIPGSVTAAKVGSFLRAWQSMAKLGGALISSVTDLTNYAAELRFGQDKNLLSGVLDGIGALAQGRAKGEKAAILNSLGVFHESTLGAVFARFDSPDLVGGKTAWAMQQFFKLNGLTWWTESLRDGYALQHSNYLASHAGTRFDKLPSDLRDMLGLYNIDAGKWDILRISPLAEADGRKYMTPEGLKTVPVAALDNYIRQAGRTVSEASILNLQDDLASALRTMTIDRMHHAVIEPNARSRAFLLRGTQPGTVTGEMLRYVTQFKSFPTAMIQMTLGREVYGRGYDTLGDYLRNGKGDMVGLATFIGLSTMMGYAAMSAKDLLRGKNPRPLDDPRTWAAALVQGGGLGIYGDFLFNKYNRMGGSLSSSLVGPVGNLADTAADLWTRVRTGDDFAAVGFNAALANTPFMNLFYTRVALDYLILYRMQEAMNPGFLRRMERRAERENGQTYYLPPSQVAR